MIITGTVINNNLPGGQHLIDFPPGTTISVGTSVACEPAPMDARAQTPIGQMIEGGYFAGMIRVDGKRYGLVMSPKAEGELQGVWGKQGISIPATHASDGLANTNAMAEHGSEIAAQVRALRIGGKDDWYIPARDELELLYRHFKPTEDENFAGFRDGENANSLPPGDRYTDDMPARTSVEAFQDPNSEALTPTWHWSSTQYSAYDAFIQGFDDGCQSNFGKYGKYRVRGVRRFLID